MWKYLVLFILFAAPAFAQEEPPPSALDVANSYVKALEAQVAFRIQQVNYLNGRVKEWEQYAKPLYEPPTQTGAK